MRKIFKSHRILTILAVVAIMVCAGSVAFAVDYALNQPAAVTVTVNPAPSGGGGGGEIPTPTTQSVYIYQDDAFSQIVNTLSFTYNTGGNYEVTRYMKSSEVTALGLSAAQTLTINKVDSTLNNITLTATIGTIGETITPVTIKAEGGSASTSPVIYSGNVIFTTGS